MFRNIYYSVLRLINGNYFIFLLLFLATSLRVHNFSSCSIWTDEGFTLELIHKSFLEILNIKDVNAPLYPLLAKTWAYFFGYSLSSIRFLSVICSVLTIWVLFRTIDKNFGRRAAIISSAFICFSNIHIYYSEEARCYSMLSLFTSLNIFYFLEIKRMPDVRNVSLYVFFSLLALYTHLFIGLLLVAQFFVLLFLFRKERRNIINLVYAYVMIAMIFGFWFFPTFFFTGKVKITGSWLPPISTEYITWFFRDLFNSEILFFMVMGALALILFLMSIVKFEHFKFKESIWQMLILAFLPFTIICTVSYLILPVFYPRYVLFVSIPLAICIGLGLSAVSWNSVGKAILIALLCQMLYNTKVSAFRNQEWDRVCHLEHAFRKDSCYVIITPLYDMNCYSYYNLRWAYDFSNDLLPWYAEQSHVTSLYDSTMFLEKKLNVYERIILYDGDPLNDHSMITYLRNNYDSVYVHRFYGIDLAVFDKRKPKINSDSSSIKINSTPSPSQP